MKRIGIYIPLTGFNTGEAQDLVVSMQALGLVDGVYVDPTTMMRHGIDGIYRALRLNSGGESLYHKLKLIMGFGEPNETDEPFALQSITQCLAFKPVMINIEAVDAHWPERVHAQIKLARSKAELPPTDVYARSRGSMRSLACHPESNSQLVHAVWQPTPPTVANGHHPGIHTPMREALTQAHLGRTLILHPTLITPRNKADHGRILRACREAATDAENALNDVNTNA